jgi:hypothetical protein
MFSIKKQKRTKPNIENLNYFKRAVSSFVFLSLKLLNSRNLKTKSFKKLSARLRFPKIM